MNNRELDAEVARFIGGKSCPHYEEVNLGSAGGPALTKTQDCECGEDAYPEKEIRSMFGTIGGPPKYSSDGNAMLRLIDKMQGCGYDVSVWSVGVKFYALFVTVNGPEGSEEGQLGSSLPEAVARAAIAALKVAEI